VIDVMLHRAQMSASTVIEDVEDDVEFVSVSVTALISNLSY